MTSGFYIYRLPGETEWIGFKGSVENNLSANGFVIVPFDKKSDHIFTIHAEKPISVDEVNNFADLKQEIFHDNIPLQSTSREAHQKRVKDITSALHAGEKCVLSRLICKEAEINIYRSLLNLAEEFPNAFIYCFYTPQSGLWLGATPELLLERHNFQLRTMALAGTRLCDHSDTKWSDKNIEEQQIVTDVITEKLIEHGVENIDLQGPYTRNAGIIEHLCTDIRGNLTPDHSRLEIIRLLFQLSPTPALCGRPRDKAISLIEQNEDYSREYYGGFLGPINERGDFRLFALLRSVKNVGSRIVMYVGGGITSKSDPEDEWVETENKAEAILKNLIF